MGRRPKKGLHYYPKDVDYYDDFKIMDLMNLYGPIGQTIYDIILCIVYREGYYLEIPPDKLAMMVMRVIGNRWVKNKGFVLQVIHYCADIGLFDKDLLSRNVITSAGIQRRYADVTARNKVDKKMYWLLDENGQAVFSTSKIEIKSSENVISVTEMQVNDSDIPQEKRKENERKGERGKVERTRAPLQPFGKFENVFLTDAEYKELGETYQSRAKLIDRLSLYKESSGKTYGNDFAKLLEWAEKDGDARRAKPRTEEALAEPIEKAPMPDEIREMIGGMFKLPK